MLQVMLKGTLALFFLHVLFECVVAAPKHHHMVIPIHHHLYHHHYHNMSGYKKHYSPGGWESHHRRKKNINNNAYSRSNLLAGTTEKQQQQQHGKTPEDDFDHIIVMKSPKKPIPLSSQNIRNVERIITKEPEFDHTIVLQAKSVKTKDTEDGDASLQPLSVHHSNLRAHGLFRNKDIGLTDSKQSLASSDSADSTESESSSLPSSSSSFSSSSSDTGEVQAPKEPEASERKSPIRVHAKPRKAAHSLPSLEIAVTTPAAAVKSLPQSDANSTLPFESVEKLSDPSDGTIRNTSSDIPSSGDLKPFTDEELKSHNTYLREQPLLAELNKTLDEYLSEPNSPLISSFSADRNRSLEDNNLYDAKTRLHEHSPYIHAKSPAISPVSYPDTTATGTIETTFNKTLEEPSYETESKVPDQHTASAQLGPSLQESTLLKPMSMENSSLELNKTLEESPSAEDKEFEREHSVHEVKPLHTLAKNSKPATDTSASETSSLKPVPDIILPKTPSLKASLNILKQQNELTMDVLEHQNRLGEAAEAKLSTLKTFNDVPPLSQHTASNEPESLKLEKSHNKFQHHDSSLDSRLNQPSKFSTNISDTDAPGVEMSLPPESSDNDATLSRNQPAESSNLRGNAGQKLSPPVNAAKSDSLKPKPGPFSAENSTFDHTDPEISKADAPLRSKEKHTDNFNLQESFADVESKLTKAIRLSEKAHRIANRTAKLHTTSSSKSDQKNAASGMEDSSSVPASSASLRVKPYRKLPTVAPLLGESNLFNTSLGTPLLQPYAESLSAVLPPTDPLISTANPDTTSSSMLGSPSLPSDSLLSDTATSSTSLTDSSSAGSSSAEKSPSSSALLETATSSSSLTTPVKTSNLKEPYFPDVSLSDSLASGTGYHPLKSPPLGSDAELSTFAGTDNQQKSSSPGLLFDDSPTTCTDAERCVPRTLIREKGDGELSGDQTKKISVSIKKVDAKTRLDDISKGSGGILGFSRISKLGCKAKFKHKGGGLQISLKRVLDDLFGEAKVPVESSSRKFVNADSFHFANEIGMITICTCGGSPGVFKMENLIAVTSVVPLKWLELRHVRVKHLEFYYKEMLDKKEGFPWNRMSISGYGLSYLGTAKQEAVVQFQKAISDAKKRPLDADMSISIQFSNDEYKDTIHVSVFLGIFGQSVTSLYPEPPEMEISRLGLESLSFNRKPPKTHMIRGTVSESNLYAIFISGDVTGSYALTTAKNVYVLCQNDFSTVINNINCALIATLDPQVFDFNSLINDMDITAIAEEVRLFPGGKIPDSIFFQSSRSSFDTINVAELRNEIRSVVMNTRRRDGEIGSEAMVISGTCFRYRLSDVSEQLASVDNMKDVDVLVNMCPGIDSIKFYLPDFGALSLSQIPTLVSDSEAEISKFQRLYGDEAMTINNLEVSKSEIGRGFRFITHIKPFVVNNTGGFHFLAKMSFLQISQSSLKIVQGRSKELILEGSGEESMLKSISTFSFGRKDSDTTMTGEMKIRSREVLFESLKDWTKKEEKEETNSPFVGLQSLTLRSLKYSATAGQERVIFSGSALLGEVSDATYQMVVYSSKVKEVVSTQIATCLYAENARASDFVNAVYGKNIFSLGWLKVDNIGVLMHPGAEISPLSRFPREFCNIDYYIKRGGTDKLALMLNNFRFDDCEKNGKSSDSCLFLKRVFRDKVPVKMVGLLRTSGLHLEGYTSREMTLGPNLILRGTRFHKNEVKNEKIHVRMIITESVNEITFEGSLKFGGDTSKELPGRIIMAGDNLMLEIPESTQTDYLDIIRNDKLEFVQLVGTASCRKSISSTESLTTLVLNSAMKIGNSGSDNALSFTDRTLVKQFIDPGTMEIRMYACKSSNTTMDVNQVLKAFGEGRPTIRGLLDKSKLKGLCVTYHEGKEKWRIDDLGLEVESGLRITAALETTFGKDGGKSSSINAEIRIDDGKSVLCVLMPPQLWAVKDRIISRSKTKLRVPRMEMYFKAESRSFGPELCYEVPFVGDRVFGYLTGYIKTVGVETDGEITISPLNMPGNMFNYMFEYSGQLFSQVQGNLRLDAIYSGQDLSDAKFKVRLDVLEHAQRTLKEHVIHFTQERSMRATRHVTKAREYLTNFTKWKKQYDDERIVLLTQHQRNKNQFRRRKIERARSMQAFAKDCSHDCGYVRVPDWSVDEKCGKNRNGQYLRCLNYVKDGHVASNVGCVATCESERVRSLVQAKQLNEAAMRDGQQVDKTQECLDLLQDAVQLINVYVDEMTESVTEIEKVTKPLRDLALFNLDNIDDKLQIERLDAEVFVEDLEDPSCLPFTFYVKLTLNENNDVVKSYSKVKRCFNGMFIRKLVEFIFEDIMRSDIEAMEKYIETMDERYASFERILKKTSKSTTARKIKVIEESFRQCHSSDTYQANLRRRSVVESSLSPLTPSLFTIFRDSTVKAFKHNSPWSVSKRRNVLDQFIKTQKRSKIRNVTHHENVDHACTAAKRAAIDYSDIATFVHKWVKEHNSARRTLSQVDKYISDDVKRTADDITKKINSTNYKRDEIENMQYWMKKAKEGISDWLTWENRRIERHNREGISMMTRELEKVYTDATHKNLKDFLNHRSSDGSNALKKGNIETPSPTIFVDLSTNLLSVLENGKSLQDISSPVEEIMKRIDGLQKRTLLCNG